MPSRQAVLFYEQLDRMLGRMVATLVAVEARERSWLCGSCFFPLGACSSDAKSFLHMTLGDAGGRCFMTTSMFRSELLSVPCRRLTSAHLPARGLQVKRQKNHAGEETEGLCYSLRQHTRCPNDGVVVQ